MQKTFVLVAPPGNGDGFSASRALTARTLDAYFAPTRFREHPSEALSVYLFFDAKSYEAYCQKTFNEPCLSRFGFWRPTERRIVMNAGPGLGTLTHELVHPIVDSDFPDAPIWINEGIASLFEAPSIPRDGEIHGVKNWRLPRLLRALEVPFAHDDAQITRLFGMKDETFRNDDEDLHYALARYFCQWLDGRGQLWTFYRAWRDGYATDPTGEKAFKVATGETPQTAAPKWTRWLRSL